MTYANGKIPGSALATTYLYYPGTANGRQLLKSIAPYAEALATAFYLEFGKPLYATDGYRDLDTQWVVWRKWLNGTGAPAAVPGTSNHGEGRALDLASNINSFSSKEHKWMKANAGKYGWAHPHWARQGGGREEAWHWEFVGGGSKEPRIERPRGLSVGLSSRGAKVREVQELLRDAGHKLTVDGDFGLATAVEVFRFQKARGLKLNGKVGAAVRRELKRKAPSKPAPSAPAKPATPSTPAAFLKGRVQRVQGAVHAAKDGKWGPDTTKRLDALEVAPRRFPFTVEFTQDVVGVRQDGAWGPKSEAARKAAVKRIQEVLGLKADGVFGPKTSAALAELKRKVSSS